MPEIAVAFEQVSKKFRRGELHDSLRDLIPDLVRRLARGKPSDRLHEKEFWALRDVDFDVRRGEAFGIIGRNGAGKSTILKLLSGLLVPTSGRVRVDGRLSALIEIGAGFHGDLTGRENVYLNGAILGMSRKEIDRKFDEIVEFSGIEEFIDTPVKRYSSGMFARLGFSVAAHLEPDVLVIDEVLSVGDAVFRTKGVEKMHEVARSGATVIFVSHDLHSVATLCDNSMLLDHGRCVEIGQTSHVIQHYLSPTFGRADGPGQGGVRILQVAVQGPDGPDTQFASGEQVRVEIQIVADEPAEGLSVGVQASDDGHYGVFHTSSQRLGLPTLSLEAGQTAQVSFLLDLHLATGTFHLGAFIYRYDVQRLYDEWKRAATIFVRCDQDVKGVVNLNPRASIQMGAGWTSVPQPTEAG